MGPAPESSSEEDSLLSGDESGELKRKTKKINRAKKIPTLKLPALKVLDADELAFSSVDLSVESQNDKENKSGDDSDEADEAEAIPAGGDDFSDDY